MSVRPLQEADAANWLALMREGTETSPSAFLLSASEVRSMTLDRAEAAMARGDTHGVFSDAQTLLGFAALHIWPLERVRHRADVGPFYVTAEARGSGAADRLMDALTHRARDAGVTWLDLWVAEDNARAQAFYVRHGFEPIGLRPDAVRIDGVSCDDLLMTRGLEPLEGDV